MSNVIRSKFSPDEMYHPIVEADDSDEDEECILTNGSVNAPVVRRGLINGNSEEYGDCANSVVEEFVNDYGTCGSDKVCVEPKVYASRYLMLLLFSLCTMMNGFQWLQYSVITSIMCCYYDVSVNSVNWTSVIFMVMYIPVNFPIIKLMNTKGLRYTLILGAAGNCLGSCIQCLSLSPDRFYVVMISQFVCSISQCFTLSVPPFLAALWFGSEEVSLACSIGVFGNQLGNALGFLIPSVLVNNDCQNKPGIKLGLMYLAFVVMTMNTILFLAIVLAFKDKPKTPPSLAEARKHKDKVTNMSAFKMMKNTQFLLLFLSYGLILAVYFAITTMLNQMVVSHFPGREVDAGRMGLISVFSGMAGNVVCGYILDKSHRYKLTSVVINALSFVCMVAYTVLIQVDLHLWIQYVMIALLGFFVSGFIPVGFEIGAEMTYPEPEGTSASLLNLSLQVLGIGITMFGSWLLQNHGDLISNLFFCGCMFIGCVLMVFVKCDLKRRKQYEHLKQLQQKL